MTQFGARVRYAPALPLPRVAFVPGRTRRADRIEWAADAPLAAPEDWRNDLRYLHGIDLYNHGFAWEAHESFEHVWRATADPRHKQFLKALIQACAAALKRELGNRAGSTRLAERAAQMLDALAPELTPRYMGLDHRAFSAGLRAFGASAEAGFQDRPLLQLE